MERVHHPNRARIREHLAQMDQKRTWTILLYDVHGYRLKEISQIMGTTMSAAQCRLARGRWEIQDRIRVDFGLWRLLDDLCEDAP